MLGLQVAPADAVDVVDHGRLDGEVVERAAALVEQRAALGDWKCNTIERTVSRLNPVVKDSGFNGPIHIKTVPWKNADLDNAARWVAGQDIKALTDVCDGVIPMSFTQILGKDPAWKTSHLDYVHDTTGVNPYSYVQFEPLIRDTPITATDIEAEIRAAEKESRGGIIYFHWEQIMGNTEKQEIVKRHRDL